MPMRPVEVAGVTQRGACGATKRGRIRSRPVPASWEDRNDRKCAATSALRASGPPLALRAVITTPVVVVSHWRRFCRVIQLACALAQQQVASGAGGGTAYSLA